MNKDKQNQPKNKYMIEGKKMEQILLDYINNYEGWVTKGQLYLIGEQEGYSPEYVGRTLRDLAESGKILRSYYKSKRNIDLARYARLDTPQVKKPLIEIVEIDGEVKAVYA